MTMGSSARELGAELLLALEGFDGWKARRNQLRQESAAAQFFCNVRASVPHYRRHFLEWPKNAALRLADFPVIAKSDIAAEPHDFVSSIGLGKPNSPLFAKTSGATGKPLTVFFDLPAWYDLNYETYGTFARQRPNVWSAMSPRSTGVVLITNERYRRQNSLYMPSLRCALFIRVALGNTASATAAALRALKKETIPILHGKPSYLLQLRDLEMAKGNIRSGIRVLSILTSGENLFSDDRRRLGEWFACPVWNAYTSAEGGAIAVECPHSGPLHVVGSRLLEVLTLQGTLQTEGWGEIVLTNLVNRAMPFVRYRTGDSARIGPDRCSCGHAGTSIFELSAREAVAFNTPTGKIATSELDDAFATAGVRQFQMIQMGPAHYRATLMSNGSTANARALENSVRLALATKLPNVRIDMAVAQALNKPGGKVRRYISQAQQREACKSTGYAALAEKHSVFVHSAIACGDFCLGGWQFAIGHDDSVMLWDLQAHSQIRERKVPCGAVRQVRWIPKRQAIVCTGTAGTAVWYLEKDTVEKVVDLEGAEDNCIAVSNDGTTLLVGSANGRVRLYDFETATVRHNFISQPSAVCALAITLDGKNFATAFASGQIEIWHLPIRQISAAVPAHKGGAYSLEFSPDGDALASGGRDGKLCLWDVATGNQLATVGRHKQPVSAVLFSADAKTIISGGFDGSVKFWHAWIAKELHSLDSSRAAVAALSSSSCNDMIAIIRKGGSVEFLRTRSLPNM